MVPAVDSVAGQKRGWELASATPATKKRKLSTSVQVTPAIFTPAVGTPVTDKKASRLPGKVADNKPLPTLPQPQSATLSNDEYRTMAASAVLQASLSRSQARWTHAGLLERYWIKPESGKNARPPPPNNPDPKWMKLKGECRIRIEPHIFECQMYVEERPKPQPLPAKPYVPTPPAHSPYAAPYRGPQYTAAQPQAQTYQHQTLPPIRQAVQGHFNTLPPINNVTQRTSSATPAPAQPGKKANPDPVITKLAGRASSDPELKTLMKEVATGSATPEQLKIFQRHIDELHDQIRKEKEERESREREDEENRRRQDAEAAAAVQEDTIRYDGAGDTRTSTPTPDQYRTPQAGTPYTGSTPLYSMAHQQPSAPSSTQNAVVLSFSTPGATEDRFLFPQYSIIERLSGNHHLASFIVTRKGCEAADPTGLDPNKEYWQPITMMLEVKLGLEDLPDYVKRWVKPAEEVRKHMEGIMKRCHRAPESWLAMRLPFKGSATTVEGEGSGVSKEATPITMLEERPGKAKPITKSSIKYVKKAQPSVKSTPAATSTAGKKQGAAKTASAIVEPNSTTASNEIAAVVAADGASDVQATTESGRPKRAVRKSVRISEG
ncbi:hypothetical protein LTR53_006241 [Teratosphaeriaceae sp. CCFEE 6253]|nr:hypothetical protein LTR53_006241 [Teratosphaeriaceae sp. CCFEE 6253]